jgi:DNA-binding NtrC family response regulator
LGDTVSHKVDVRLISAANCSLQKEVEAGRFRSDLFYRLHILTLSTPPLRERREDIPLVANHYLQSLVCALKASNSAHPGAPELFAVARSFSPAAMMKLMNFPWPGNVRELQNVIEKAVAPAAGPAIEPQDLDFSAPPSRPASESLLQQKSRMVHDFMHQKLEEILSEHHWNYKEAAEACGMDRRSLYALAVKYDLKRPQSQSHHAVN